MRHRYYAPSQGRFITRDPLGYVNGLNLYEFVAGSPHNLSDPLGLDWATDTLCFAQELEGRRNAVQQLPRLIGGQVNRMLNVMTFVNNLTTVLGNFIENNWQIAAMGPLDENPFSLQSVADFSAGFGDMFSSMLTFGLFDLFVGTSPTAWVRQRLGYGDVVNSNSTSYRIGQASGFLFSFAFGTQISGKQYQIYDVIGWQYPGKSGPVFAPTIRLLKLTKDFRIETHAFGVTERYGWLPRLHFHLFNIGQRSIKVGNKVRKVGGEIPIDWPILIGVGTAWETVELSQW